MKYETFLALLSITALTWGCETRTPITPSVPPDSGAVVMPSAAPGFTLSGTVYESTRDGRRPLAGAPLDISLDYQARSPITTTDADGRYSFMGSSLAKLNVRVEKAGYSQPCRAAIALSADRVMDVYVVADATLSVDGVPASMPVIQPTLSGTVFERASEGVRTVPGVKVIGDFSAGLGWGPSATTVTDAAGRYLLCGVDGSMGLELWIPRLRRYLPVNSPMAATLDIDVTQP